MIRLIERARELTGEPAIGIHLGMQMRISAFGYLGFTASSAATLGDALALATQFAPVLSDAFDVKLRTAGGSAALALEERAAFGSVRDVVLIRLLLGLAKIGSTVVGRELPVSIDLAIDEPSYYASFAAALPRCASGNR